MAHAIEHLTSRLSERWRREAGLFRRRGSTTAAEMAESFATELDAEVMEWLDESLTLREAADYSGYAYSTLEHRVRLGELPNAGETGRPRVRRRDLPLRADGSHVDVSQDLKDLDDPDDLDELLRVTGP